MNVVTLALIAFLSGILGHVIMRSGKIGTVIAYALITFLLSFAFLFPLLDADPDITRSALTLLISSAIGWFLADSFINRRASLK